MPQNVVMENIDTSSINRFLISLITMIAAKITIGTVAMIQPWQENLAWTIVVLVGLTTLFLNLRKIWKKR